TNTVFSASWSPDGTVLITGSRDGDLRFWSWDGENLTHVATVDGHEGNLRSLAWSPDGTTIATAGFDGTIRLWNAATRTVERVLTGHDENEVRSVQFSPDGKQLVTTGNDGTVRIWDAESGAPIRTLQ